MASRVWLRLSRSTSSGMRVVLLTINASFVHTSLGARYLEAVCREAGVTLAVVESNINEGIEVITGKVARLHAELLLCSVYIWNRRIMEDVCTRIRLMDPGVTIAWGGPEVSGGWEEILAQGDVDYVVCGEGEAVILSLIGALAQGERPRGAGITWRGGPKPRVEMLQDLDKLPFPYAYEKWQQNKIYYFETSRGCPYTCAYCLSSCDPHVRYMSVDNAKARLSHMVGRVPLIKFVDRTFNADPARARGLWEFLQGTEGETRFHFEICAHLLSGEDFALLADPRAQRFQLEVGLQSISPTSLQAVNRHVDANQTLDRVKRLVQLGTAEVQLDLIAGLPEETPATFLHAVNAALAALPHRLYLGFLKLLPGTPLRQRAGDLGLVFLPFAPYEVLRTPHMSSHDFLYFKSLAQALDRCYNSQQAERALRYALTQATLSGVQVLERLSAAEGVTVQESVYLALQTHVPDPEVLRELCRFDYLLHEPHKRVPAVLMGEQPPEDTAVREIVYKQPERLFAALPHRRGEKPGAVLRQLRWGKFSRQALALLALPDECEVLFDHGLPRKARVCILH